jgi:hypothetical protein
MSTGIRAFARETFVTKNELRRRGEAYTGPKGNTEFRKDVMCAIMTQHGVTLASAATHYNDAFKFLKELNAELVSGLGRPEDKKGGRKKKAVVVDAEAVKAIQGPVTPTEDNTAQQEGTMSDVAESNLLTAPTAEVKQEAVFEEAPF